MPHMIRYTVKAGRVAENEALVQAIFDELEGVRPDGLRYVSFKLDDGVTFINLIWHDKAQHGPVPKIAAFKAFHQDFRDRCDGTPTRTELSELGAYGL